MSFLDQLKDYTAKSKNPVADLASGAGALYFGNQAVDVYGDSVGAYDRNIGNIERQMSSMPALADLFGPNSPYAVQLREQLARKDAAAGRNSQYGPREAQLQALLAEKGSAYMSQQASAMNQLQQSLAQQQTARQTAQMGAQQARAQQLANLFKVADNMGWTDKINQGLSSYFQPEAPSTMVDKSQLYGDEAYGNTYYGPMSDTWDGSGATGMESVPQATDAGTGGYAGSDLPYQWY